MAESEKFLILGQHPSIVKFLYGLIEITIMALDENLNYLPNKEDSEEWIIDSGFSSAFHSGPSNFAPGEMSKYLAANVDYTVSWEDKIAKIAEDALKKFSDNYD